MSAIKQLNNYTPLGVFNESIKGLKNMIFEMVVRFLKWVSVVITPTKKKKCFKALRHFSGNFERVQLTCPHSSVQTS